jgi:NAD(P)-dependent dehydrogenase (short-subunit alcohol dehydrogenase family)
MQGKSVVVTGGSSGIGLETAVGLARAGARVLVTARNAARGAEAVADIRARSGNSEVEQVLFDLGSIPAVRAGAAEILERLERIDVLVNNAGLVLTERQETPEGLEAQFAINHLGPFLLTRLLLERIQGSGRGRIVTVASTAHRAARKGLNFEDLQSRQDYKALRVYARCKLANILFTKELARRLAGSGTTANCLHPGTVATSYGKDGDTTGVLSWGTNVIKPFILSPEKGARTSIFLASSPEVEGITGTYFIRCKPRKTSPAAQDPEAARRLWQISEELVGLAGTSASA